MTTTEPAVETRPSDPKPGPTPGPPNRASSMLRAGAYGGLLTAALVLAPIAWSFGHALTRPGTDPLGVRATEWVRDHGGRPLVAWAENSWYEHHQPKKGGVPALTALPVAAVSRAAPPTAPPVVAPTTDKPVNVRILAATPLPNEGVWQPTGRMGSDGLPLLYTTFIRPDAVHTSLVTGLAWMDPKRLRFDLYSGTQQPGGPGWQLEAPLPFDVRAALVAAFNSGFKLQDSHGGYFAEGREAPGHPLVNGLASLIIHTDGTATVGMWGRDAVAGPGILAVRQNLNLLIDGAVEAPDLDQNSLARWGWTVKNATLVWRSGIGVDAAGHLIYAAGNGLSVRSLADVLLAAGCVRAMELDINSEWVDFYSYTSDPAVPGGAVGTKLIPDMRPPIDQYFEPSDRDFIATFERYGI